MLTITAFALNRIAHLLVDGPIPINKIKVGLTDHIVQSLRGMPEHKNLTTCWSAMLKAIRSENANPDRQEREELARTRVLLRMLASAASLEVVGQQEQDSRHVMNSSVSLAVDEEYSLEVQDGTLY